MTHIHEQPQYNSWIRIRKLLILGLVDVFLIVCLVVINNLVVDIIIGIGLGIISYILIIVGCSYYLFTVQNYQHRIHQLITTQVHHATTRPVLDIGAGSGSLSILLAKKFPANQIFGLDYWGADWEYSKALCEHNTSIEKVANTTFIQGSASHLPFDNCQFGLITSCLTFHEVKDCDCIYSPIAESIRVLADGGQYLYLDLFLDPNLYPNLEMHLEQLLGSDYHLTKLTEIIDLPLVLRHQKVLGKAAIITGYKKR